MTTPACMGGWCSKRAGCLSYLADDRREPAERLCDKGLDGQSDHPVRFHRPAGTWERGAGVLLAPAEAMPS